MPVQEQVLTSAFGGQDLYVQSQTGTGKTAAFLIVIFQRLLLEPDLHGKKAIIMVPTRELAVQVEEEAKVLGRYLPFTVGSFYGGVGYAVQQQLLKDNAQIMVGTPGRVLDLNASGRMNLMEIAFLVLDEADRMFDMGFYPDLRKLIKVIPPADRRQTMLFSATLNARVKNLAWEYTKSPVEIEIAPETVTVDEVDQVLYHVPSGDKMRFLLGIIEREQPDSAIIFCNTKRYTEIVARRLRVNGIPCEFIIGDLPQVQRLNIIEDVKAGKVRFLVATDVAARGLDIEGLAMVVNYDLPEEAENYVHRIGRTARAGKTGRAITLASEQDVYELPEIERYIGKKIPAETAVAALYGEDQSEGMRIRTDVYDDRPGGVRQGPSRRGGRDQGRGRDRTGGGRAGAGGGRDRRFAAEDRTGGGGNFAAGDGGGGRGRGGRSAASGDGGGSRGRNRNEGRDRERSGGRRQDRDGGTRREPAPKDLSRLSFEERMAYYKQKYDAGPETGRAAGGAAGKESGRNRGRRQGRGRNEGRGRDRQGQERPASGREKAAPPAAAKPGLVGRFLGMFKKKP
jgi:ATP-dependent RNA helicase RhlB